MILISLQELRDIAQESLHDVVDDDADILACYASYPPPNLDENVEEDW